MRRHKLSSGHSKKMFTKHGLGTHRKNVANRTVMRGGIRL